MPHFQVYLYTFGLASGRSVGGLITTRQEQYSRDRVTTNILENRTSRSPDSNFYRYSLSRLRSPCACGISLEVSGNLGASHMLERTLKLGYSTGIQKEHRQDYLM